jgi:hypothetical protein
MVASIAIGLVVFPVGIIYASFAEWVIHRGLMHHPFLWFKHFFNGHAKVHHRKYQGGATYSVGDRPHDDLTLAWWAMPLPTLFHVPFLLIIAVWVSAPAAVSILVAFALYQATYEYLHYCMHVPRNRWFERTGAFRWINAHHLQHHKKHNTNLNIVLPIADFLLGTRQRPRQRTLSEA